nr:RNA polymerase subunit sigma-70 [Parablautia muri]
MADYIDACELIKETEQDIRRMKKDEVVQDKVNGSNPDFPYQKMSFHLSGVMETYLDSAGIEKEKNLLIERKWNAEKLKRNIEKWMGTIPSRMQRIIRMRYFEGKSWEEVAIGIGRNATADSVRKEFDRFIRKK